MDLILARISMLLTGAWRSLGSTIVDTRWQFAPAGQLLLMVGLPAALIVAGLCYFRTTEGLTWRSRFTLAMLRFVSLVCLLIMLAGAVVVIELSQQVRPQLLLLIDDSPSMTLPGTSGSSRAQSVENALTGGLTARLAETFDVQSVRTSQALDASDETESRRQDLTRSIILNAAKSGQMGGDIVVVSDGVQTSGITLARAAAEVSATVHTLTVDDASDARDLVVRDVSVPPFVYAHDRVMATARVLSRGLDGESTVTLLQTVNGTERPVATVKVNLRADGEPTLARLEWEAPDAGLTRYTLRAAPLTGEMTDLNNVVNFQLDVRPERIRVLYVEGEPAWEYRYAKQAMESDPAVDFYGLVRMPDNEWFFQGNNVRADGKPFLKSIKNGFPTSPDELNAFDVLILGDLERKFFEQGDRFALVENFVRQRGGGLVTLGGFKVYGAGDYEGTDLARMLPFEVTREKKLQLINRFNPQLTTQGMMHPIMQLEFDPEQNARAWASLPWVEGGNAIPAAKSGATTLLVHPTLRSKFGARPVAAAWQYGRGRVFSTALDGTWHWRLARTTETDYHRRYWGLICRWLGGDPRTQAPIGSLSAENPVTEVDQEQTFFVVVRDPDMNPILDADVQISIEDPSQNLTTTFAIPDPATPGRYAVSLTPTHPGEYKVKAVVTTRTDQSRTQQQTYFAQPSRAEFLQTTGDAPAMAALAKAGGGTSKMLSDWRSLQLPARSTVVQSNVLTVSLWQSKGLLGVLLLCLGSEWLLRKRRGLA